MVTDVELANMFPVFAREAEESKKADKLEEYVVAPLMRAVRCVFPGWTTYCDFFSRSNLMDPMGAYPYNSFLELSVGETDGSTNVPTQYSLHGQYIELRNMLLATFSKDPNPEMAEGLPRAYGVAYQLMRRGGAALQVAAPVSLAFNPELAIPLYIGGTAMKTGAIALDTVVAQMCDNDDGVFVGPLQRIKHRLGIGAKQGAETIDAPDLQTAIA